MSKAPFQYCTQPELALETLATTPRLLIIQDLDGVCMELVHDPLTRQLELNYLHAAKQLQGEFFVLTNGEHIGSRGVNNLVNQCCEALDPTEQSLYLPGLAAGGVQFQNSCGEVSHPGVSDAELDYLQQVPAKMRHWLQHLLRQPPFSLTDNLVKDIITACVLDNRVSPTLNLNIAYQALAGKTEQIRKLQQLAAAFCSDLIAQASAQGLTDSFFLHLAPNLGQDNQGERIKPADGSNFGTTDFQFMLQGGVKEVGVLVLLNRYYHQQTGQYPLGEGFNARIAPRDRKALLELAETHFDPALMPVILGVGDTLTASTAPTSNDIVRGGSDRGFLELVQALGESFDSSNLVAFVDSSSGELKRPSVQTDYLPEQPGQALAGISDNADPLQINLIFPGGHRQYIAFFQTLAAMRQPR